ncbi:MAG: DUF2752 domain-containing protein [Lachnospiraceae bacterium]|nr:DUF2752 domain-containing protein [Lachnospiraceae bacterium]
MKGKGLSLLKEDIRNNYKGILIVIIYSVVTQLVFGFICPFRLVTGIPCPGCGLTRAGLSLIKLDFGKVLYYNVMIIPIAIYIIYAVVCRYVLGTKVRFATVILIILAVALLVLYFYRMVRFFPNHKPMEYVGRNLFWPIYTFVKGIIYK